MNYLAHAYLSFQQPEILVGNMIGDFVKGKKQYDYPSGILKGIQLHRAIDIFTDGHEATRKAKEFFRKDYRLYAGAIVDVAYDHYLAIDANIFPAPTDLERTAGFTYHTLEQYFDLLPERFQLIFPHMKTQNWLFNYQFEWGVEKSLTGLVKRSLYMENSSRAFSIFKKNYHDLAFCYKLFFPQIKEIAEKIIFS